MMPNLTTPVLAPKMPFSLDFASGIVSLGSCFADEVGSRLQESDFPVELNPFGTLYNPASIAAALHRLIEDLTAYRRRDAGCMQQPYPPSPQEAQRGHPADGDFRHSMDI